MDRDGGQVIACSPSTTTILVQIPHLFVKYVTEKSKKQKGAFFNHHCNKNPCPVPTDSMFQTR